MDAGAVLREIFPSEAEAARMQAEAEGGLSVDERFRALDDLFLLMTAFMRSRGEPLDVATVDAAEQAELAPFLAMAGVRAGGHAGRET